MKKVMITVIAAIIAIFCIGIGKDQIIKSVVTVAAGQVTGAPVHIDNFSLGILTQSARIAGFKMYNPQGFSKDILVDLPAIKVKYDIWALLKKKIHLVSVEIELKEMVIEKNKDGKLNVDSLKAVKQGEKEKTKDKISRQMPMRIDVVKLDIGKIVFRDYTLGAGPSIKVYDINIHKSYKDITSAEQLAALILAESVKSAGIRGTAIYGAAMLTGVGILPVAAAATFGGKDSVQQDFTGSFDRVYEVSMGVLKQMGSVTKEDKAGGIIEANIRSTAVTLKLKKKADNKTWVIISAKKYLLPRPEIANGVLYEISERLK